MLKNERQREILSILQKRGYAGTAYLAKITYSSLPTVRRDLIHMEAQGYITRSHGGAMLAEEKSSVSPLDYRKTLNRQQKRILCSYAARYLKDSQTIFIDESTTTAYLSEFLGKFKNLTVISNGLLLANALAEKDITFYCTGGRLIHNNYFCGKSTEDFIERFNADLFFFSSFGITADGRISDQEEQKASFVRCMLRHAAQSIYLCDESKVGKISKYNVASRSDVYKILTTASSDKFDLPAEKLICLDWGESESPAEPDPFID